MATTAMARWLLLFAGAGILCGCGPKVASDPPPQNVSSVPAESDGGLPAVPLTREGVVVPSDVKLQPGPKDAPPPASDPVGASFRPLGN
jgi:hypothetical protein